MRNETKPGACGRKPGQMLAMEEATNKSSLAMKKEPSEELTVKGETGKGLIDSATSWHHASTHLSGNDVPLQVIRSSDEENVSKSLQDSGLRFKKTESNENPIVKGAQRDLRCNPLRNKAEFRDRGEGDNSENDVPLCASLSSNDEETMKTTSTRRQIRAIFLHEFKMGRSAAATSRKINRLFGPRFAKERTVQCWFKKFREGNESLEDDNDDGSLRPVEVHNDQVRATTEAGSRNNTLPPTHCVECGEIFGSPSQLWDHVCTKHGKVHYCVCGECGKKFYSRAGLKSHVEVVHKNLLYMCPCKGCDHPGYRRKQALKQHIRSAHKNIRPYVCEACGIAFSECSELKTHSLIHNCEKVYKCECGSTFSYKTGLETHMRLCLMH